MCLLASDIICRRWKPETKVRPVREKMSAIEIIIPADPWPQMRARHTKNGFTYRHHRQVAAEVHTMTAMSKFLGGHQPFIGPVEVEMVFTFMRPKSHFRAGGLLKDSAGSFHLQKPDTDNLIKHILDCASRLNVWRDDCQVVSTVARKGWGTVGSSFIKITELQR